MAIAGIIAWVGRLLADAGVNIASFNLGRENGERGNGAIALVHVDEEISPDLLRGVQALPHVKQAKVLSF